MYNILIVDDEPLICKGLSSLLGESGLPIENVYIAHNGYEALDYLRMEEIDLLVTDIQMGSMSGLDLMHQAKMFKPWVQTIVISAHEDFHYAQLAIRLGAKDYMIKPLNGNHFTDTVRNVLLKMDKATPSPEELITSLSEDFMMQEPHPQSTIILNEMLGKKEESRIMEASILKLRNEFGMRLEGPYYAIVRIRLSLDEDNKGRLKSENDRHLFRYAALNIVCESLGKDWKHVTIHSPHDELSVILQWNEEEYVDSRMNKIVQLELIGRSLYVNIYQNLQIGCLIGISQIMRGPEFLFELSKQAEKAILLNDQQQDNHVFYYGDFNWNLYAAEPSVEDIHAQNNSIVEGVKAFIHEHYHQKGLTLHEVAQKNHVSPNYLSYLFKKYTGFNLWEYVIKLRMEESKRLILHTDLRRYEIAEQVGYESPEHFSKIFKKYFGITPSELKK